MRTPITSRRNGVRYGICMTLLVSCATLASANPPSPLFMNPSSEEQHRVPTGTIEDTRCTSSDLERANDSQLYEILQELKQTTFFRNFYVDLEQQCPLHERKKKKLKDTKKMQQQPEEIEESSGVPLSSPSEEEEEEEGEPPCEGGLEDLDEDAGPACGVAQEADPFASAMSFTSSSSSTTTPPKERSTPSMTVESKTTSTESSSFEEAHEENTEENDNDDEDDNDDEFECSGGDDLDLDEDAEPLCHLTDDYDGDSARKISEYLMSAALQTIRFLGFESEAQRQTFDWSSSTDPVQKEQAMMSTSDEEHCDDDASYWNDMCHGIQIGASGKVVNLALNPERNTGYNGTEIWKAMYQENCLVPTREDEQCYEERVLYKLLSGLHTSTTLSIATYYYPPSKRKNRTDWEPNPTLFWNKFHEHPEYLRNLHFSYVVMLRALRKASKYLYDYPQISTGDVVEDETAQILLRRLLDSAILKSCRTVFDAFDETMMFKQDVTAEASPKNELISLKSNFKGVFQNISSILDCVQCQQCKLHGKMAMLGYGTALKILFTRGGDLFLERNEIVALVQTVAKFSESIKEVRHLTQLYWQQQHGDQQNKLPSRSSNSHDVAFDDINNDNSEGASLVDTAIGLAVSLGRQGLITSQQETELVSLALAHKSELLSLVKHYGRDEAKFLQLASSTLLKTTTNEPQEPDAIIVGSGLAGLAAALNLLDRDGHVVIMEKEHRLGGNSNKASSGINACCFPDDKKYDGDVLDAFRNDTTKSAGSAAQPQLIDVLVGKSSEAVAFLRERAGVDLSLLAQLGGHSYKRTHRPSNGMAGAEIIYGMQKAVKEYEKKGMVRILVDTRVTKLITKEEVVVGVEYQKDGASSTMNAANVVLATGGFAADRTSGSYLEQYRPELLNMPATAGGFSTGDGITMAKALGANTINMDKVQLHPTGWVDPKDPTSPSKILAAELMRGVGGILLNSTGQRFCNELGTRAYVTDRMLSHNEKFVETNVWDKEAPIPISSLVLSSSAAADGKKHVDLYSHKGLLTKLHGISALAEWMGMDDEETLRATMERYQMDAENGSDAWGKSSFRGVPQMDLDNETFYAGRVVPVLHYCMGGITIDTEGNVLGKEGDPIRGLHAAGEVTGGVHGNNRLGGNSLLECTVFGTIVGKKLPIQKRNTVEPKETDDTTPVVQKVEERDVNVSELQQHYAPESCWISIKDVVYDMTDFAEEHPAGPQSIHDLCGKDGTEAFEAVHNAGILDDFGDERRGRLVLAGADDDVQQSEADDDNGNVPEIEETTTTTTFEQQDDLAAPTSPQTNENIITMEELALHNDEDDLWTVFHGGVYDLSEWYEDHPGGPQHLLNVAGRDGTSTFDEQHSKRKLKLIKNYKVGEIETNENIITREELALHNDEDDLWTVFHGGVYDLSEWHEDHPGGPQHLLNVAGMDGTSTFDEQHSKRKLKLIKDYKVGELET